MARGVLGVLVGVAGGVAVSVGGMGTGVSVGELVAVGVAVPQPGCCYCSAAPRWHGADAEITERNNDVDGAVSREAAPSRFS